MPLSVIQIDRLVRSAFAEADLDDIYGNGLCQAFSAGLATYLREVDPGQDAKLLVAEHEGAFDHTVLHLPALDATFDWQGAGAMERWTDHRGGAVDWAEVSAPDAIIAGSRFSGAAAQTVRDRLAAKAREIALPEISRVPVMEAGHATSSSTPLTR